MKFTNTFEMSIVHCRHRITKSAKSIKSMQKEINKDERLKEDLEFSLITEEYLEEYFSATGTTDSVAADLLKKNDIKLYVIKTEGIDKVLRILNSENIDVFIKNIEDYAHWIEDLRDTIENNIFHKMKSLGYFNR